MTSVKHNINAKINLIKINQIKPTTATPIIPVKSTTATPIIPVKSTTATPTTSIQIKSTSIKYNVKNIIKLNQTKPPKPTQQPPKPTQQSPKPNVVTKINKSALLIGCNYLGSQYELRGCINDVNNLKTILTSRFKFNNSNILTDVTINKPTKTNILNNFKNLLVNSKSGDILFFCFSGHGSQTYDYSGDEKDGLDELIVSKDLNYISDDEFKSLLVNYMKDNVKLFVLFDSCHSGSMMDLKYQYLDSTNMNMVIMNTDSQPIKGTVVMISGCMDMQTSADAYINNKSQGAMTWSFINSITTKQLNIIDTVKNMRNLLKTNNYDQIPQLSSNIQIDNLNIFL